MRVEEIRRLYNVQIHFSTLLQFYKKNNIQDRTTNYTHLHIKTKEWKSYKDFFVVKLCKIIKSGVPLCYMDETSIHSWQRKTKTFKGPFDNVKIVLPKQRIGGTTVYGCISNFTDQNAPFTYMLAKSTNTEDMCSFLT